MTSKSTQPRRSNPAAGIWEIHDVRTGEKMYRFRARKHADVQRGLQIVYIGLKRPMEDFEAVRVADRD